LVLQRILYTITGDESFIQGEEAFTKVDIDPEAPLLAQIFADSQAIQDEDPDIIHKETDELISAGKDVISRGLHKGTAFEDILPNTLNAIQVLEPLSAQAEKDFRKEQDVNPYTKSWQMVDEYLADNGESYRNLLRELNHDVPVEEDTEGTPSDEIDEEEPPVNDHRSGGFIFVPPLTTVGQLGDEHPNIDVKRAEKQIGVLQKTILSVANQAYNTAVPLVGKIADIMVDIGMVMNNIIQSELVAGDHVNKKLPSKYRKNKGEAFFDLMDKHFSPEEIEAADLPKKVKDALHFFKKAEEVMRLEAIKIKRALVTSVLNRQTVEQVFAELQKLEAKPNIELREKGRQGKRLYNVTEGRFISKGEVTPLIAKNIIPDNWGRQWDHIYHAFFGQFQLIHTEIDPETGEKVKHFIGRAETETEAYVKLANWLEGQRAAGVENVDKLDVSATPEIMIPMDVTRLGTKHVNTLISRLAEAANIESQIVRDAARGVIGTAAAKQKFISSFLYRKGVEGYSKDFWKVWTAEVTQFYRWKYLSEMNRAVTPMIEQLQAMGQTGWAKYLNDLKRSMWGSDRSQASINLDHWLGTLPVIRNNIRPYALERWVGIVKTINYMRFLQTPAFAVKQMMQIMQTLWPVAGERGLIRGFNLLFSAEGQEILRRHHVSGTSGKMFEVGVKRFRRLEKILPAGFTETFNQDLAFLTLYQMGRDLGMSDAKAARYGRLRGQVMTQFATNPADVPPAMRHPIGGLILQFQRYRIKDLELCARLAREGNYGGVVRWVTAKVLFGGASMVLGMAASIPVIGAGIGYISFRMYKKIREEYGEELANFIFYGLPGLVGIDMSTSVTPVDVPFGRNIYEKTGNIIFGPSGTTAVRLITDITREDVAKEIGVVPRGLKSLVDGSPTVSQFVFLLKALQEDTLTYDAKQRAKHRFDTWELWKKALGFRVESEALQRLNYDGMYDLNEAHKILVDRVSLALIDGRQGDAEEEIRDWNAFFPEAPISGDAIVASIKAKIESREFTLTERGIQNLPKNLRAPFLEFQAQLEGEEK
jgi:hypothetical protein